MSNGSEIMSSQEDAESKKEFWNFRSDSECVCCSHIFEPESEPTPESSVEVLEPEDWGCFCKLSSSQVGSSRRSSSQSTVQFVLDPKANKTGKKKKIVQTAEEIEREKANKYELFNVECDIGEAVKTIEKLSEQHLRLVSKKKRRDADLQRFEMKIGEKKIKKNCVHHNWELFEVQEKYRALRIKYFVLMYKEADIDREIKNMTKKVQRLEGLAMKSDDETLDNLEHLQVRWAIQTQLYEQDFERLHEEEMVLERDLRLLEEGHLRQLVEEKNKLNSLKKELFKMKKEYFKLIEEE